MTKKIVFVLIALVLLIASPVTSAFAEWQFGIGTGPQILNVDGDMGFNTNLAGPVKFAVKLDPDDISDLTNTAFGFGGYATDGKWLIEYSLGKLELEGNATKGPVSAKIGFDVTGGELLVSHPFYQQAALRLNLLGGARYTKHELSSVITVGATQLNRNIDNDWTDFVVGVSLNVPLHKDWTWRTRVDAGYGGSDGTYTGKTGVDWHFHKHWTTTLSAKYQAIEFENGSRGDTDWYLYDVDESSMSLALLFVW